MDYMEKQKLDVLFGKQMTYLYMFCISVSSTKPPGYIPIWASIIFSYSVFSC